MLSKLSHLLGNSQPASVLPHLTNFRCCFATDMLTIFHTGMLHLHTTRTLKSSLLTRRVTAPTLTAVITAGSRLRRAAKASVNVATHGIDWRQIAYCFVLKFKFENSFHFCQKSVYYL